MKYIRFKTRQDQIHWNFELSNGGEVTLLRGGIYFLADSQIRRLQDAGVEFVFLSREEVDATIAELKRETA